MRVISDVGHLFEELEDKIHREPVARRLTSGDFQAV